MLWSLLVFVRTSVHYNGDCFSETQLSKEEKGSPKTLTPYGYESLREVSKYGVFPWSVFSRIRTEMRENTYQKNPYLDTFQAVNVNSEKCAKYFFKSFDIMMA